LLSGGGKLLMISAKARVEVPHSTRSKAAEMDVFNICALNRCEPTCARFVTKIDVIPVQRVLLLKATDGGPILSGGHEKRPFYPVNFERVEFLGSITDPAS
jgi:hypothetical protein